MAPTNPETGTLSHHGHEQSMVLCPIMKREIDTPPDCKRGVPQSPIPLPFSNTRFKKLPRSHSVFTNAPTETDSFLTKIPSTMRQLCHDFLARMPVVAPRTNTRLECAIPPLTYALGSSSGPLLNTRWNGYRHVRTYPDWIPDWTRHHGNAGRNTQARIPLPPLHHLMSHGLAFSGAGPFGT